MFADRIATGVLRLPLVIPIHHFRRYSNATCMTVRQNMLSRRKPELPIRDCRMLIDPLILVLFVAIFARRGFNCRQGLVDGFSDFFVV